MTKLAETEKLPGADHWTVYDGRGGVFRAKRDTGSGWWTATRISGTGGTVFTGRTLRDVRRRIAASEA